MNKVLTVQETQEYVRGRMIGSLVYYVLFPLTRFIHRFSGKRPKHGLAKEGPSVFMNGSEVWDGGGSSLQGQNEEQTACLGQGLSVASVPQEQEKGGGLQEEEEWERVADAQEPGDGQKEGLAVDDESRKEGENLRDEEGNEAQEEGLEVASGPLAEGSRKEVGTQEKEGGVTQSEEFRVVQAMVPGKEGQQQECVSEKQGQEGGAVAGAGGPDSNRGAESAEEDLGEEQHDLGEGQHEASGSVLDLGALLAETNVHPWAEFVQPLHAGWHFPTGPGLGEVVHCPSWQFPDMSYYPQQETMPFEVAWRVWENLSGAHTESERLQGAGVGPQEPFEFTVMSYNILAQDLLEANPDLYQHCAPEVLAWEFRLQNILREFEKWDPDILCLQEVQEDHYTEQLHPALSDMGYACVYKKRTGAKTDGCAICYRRTRFVQLSFRLVEYYRPWLEMLDRDNVGVVLLLQPVSLQGSEVTALGSPLCVANTHLLFNPRRGDVKLAQLAMILAEIDATVKGTSCPVILCGDFNSVPNMPLYNFITTQQLYYHGLPAWMISGQEDLSYKTHHRRLYAPLWPSSLGISDNCQYVCGGAAEGVESGKLNYDREFLLGLRFCEAALIRPEVLELIPGVTDATPDPLEKQPYIPRFRYTIHHAIDLWSAYSHFITDTNRPEVTTLHSEFGATVDYIFYSARTGGVGHLQHGGLQLIGRLSLLSEDDLWPMKGLPNEIFSSDHLCLLAKFQLDLDHV
ncbi:hypothetical protein AAFF_G00011700 [Aldrovandia affinis]|uniref:Endonuclease/exonuclease/phosphatase domain-containing protein n=1 Tax=Aldrovandia affinis TaxID=143900 RepID=A0AAD7S6Y6_9TELE|nr:hypothetical protein AAFF_G00011700 [Aldrovandia affinis]